MHPNVENENIDIWPICQIPTHAPPWMGIWPRSPSYGRLLRLAQWETMYNHRSFEPHSCRERLTVVPRKARAPAREWCVRQDIMDDWCDGMEGLVDSVWCQPLRDPSDGQSCTQTPIRPCRPRIGVCSRWLPLWLTLLVRFVRVLHLICGLQ